MYKRIDRIFYIIGWIGLGLCIVAGLFIHFGLLDFIHGYELCTFHRVTGLYCPGCGMTRAVFELVGAHPIRSLGKNIGLLGYGSIYAYFMIYHTYELVQFKKQGELSQNNSRLVHKRLETALIIVSALFILQWIVKNLLLIIWHIDLLAK